MNIQEKNIWKKIHFTCAANCFLQDERERRRRSEKVPFFIVCAWAVPHIERLRLVVFVANKLKTIFKSYKSLHIDTQNVQTSKAKKQIS